MRLTFNEKFIAGRLERRLMRLPRVVGWTSEDGAAEAPQRAAMGLVTKDDDAFGLRVPGQHDLARLSAEAGALLAGGRDLEVMIGWPEMLVIVRSGGVVLYAEGDPLHFGALRLDGVHTLRRSGFEYLNDTTAEVRVELAHDVGDEVHTHLLGPGETVAIGPYEVFHDRSFDPTDRQTSVRQHSYFLRLRRAASAPTVARDARLPHPLALDRAEDVVVLARATGALDAGEALLAEPAAFAHRLELYEGPAQTLERAVRDCGPDPATFTRRGEVVEVTSARVWRTDKGEARIGRATLGLHPIGGVVITREDHGSVPGRMRRSTHTG